ncbi:MAG: metalloregulator ArsR/SmtB family transcription factor [Acidimicrobiales bacterium]|nr:metalloregulator ArsR/SmtB family transcription factor [Acidimicrobiales bacterium]
MEELLTALRATSEQTRLRIIAVLSRTELTVSELCRVLGQSQPRVSRHLKLLCDAGVLERNAEGSHAFYQPARIGLGRQVLDSIITMIDPEDETIVRDLDRLAAVRDERAAIAAAYFEEIAKDWDRLRTRHVQDEVVEAAMLSAVEGQVIRDFLDIGTGSGRILEIFAPRVSHGLGVDLSHEMLNVARARLDEKGLQNISLRKGDIYHLDLPDGSQDVVVIHHVLHFLDAPQDALAEAARVLRPNGHLLIVDFAPHDLEYLRMELAHRRLGIHHEDIETWATNAGLTGLTRSDLHPSGPRQDGQLTTILWTLRQHSDATDFRTLAHQPISSEERSA